MKSTFFLVFIFTTSVVFGQESNIWEKHTLNEFFEISTQKINCTNPSQGINKEYLFLKIANKSNESLTLTYKVEKWYNGVNSNSDEGNQYTIKLSPGESVEGSCENYRNGKLAIFSKMTGTSNARKLTNYTIIPLSVNGKKL